MHEFQASLTIGQLANSLQCHKRLSDSATVTRHTLVSNHELTMAALQLCNGLSSKMYLIATVLRKNYHPCYGGEWHGCSETSN